MSSNPYLERIKPYGAVNDALAQAQWAEKKWVWLVDKAEGFIPGHIVEENGDSVKITLLDETVFLYNFIH
jgi:hypothetical protein